MYLLLQMQEPTEIIGNNEKVVGLQYEDRKKAPQ